MVGPPSQKKLKVTAVATMCIDCLHVLQVSKDANNHMSTEFNKYFGNDDKKDQEGSN